MIRVLENQNIWDIAMVNSGSLESAFDILIANGKNSLTIAADEELKIPSVSNIKLVEYFQKEKIVMLTSSAGTGTNLSFSLSFSNSFQ